MKEKIKLSRDMILRSLDAVFSIIVLPLATYSDIQNEQQFLLLNVTLFIALCLAKVFQMIRAKESSGPYGWLAVKAGAFLVSALLLLVIPDKSTARTVIGIMLMVVLLLECILFIWRRRNFNSILCGGACILTLCLVIKGDYYRILLYSLVQVFVHIVILSFSQMNLKVLIKIIRKTHAANILAGLLLLMTAASFMIPPLEKSIPTFLDALWYCFAIVTTIGFGDYYAVSPSGRIISVLLGLYGLVVVALVTSIIVNFYLEVRDEPDEEEGQV